MSPALGQLADRLLVLQLSGQAQRLVEVQVCALPEFEDRERPPGPLAGPVAHQPQAQRRVERLLEREALPLHRLDQQRLDIGVDVHCRTHLGIMASTCLLSRCGLECEEATSARAWGGPASERTGGGRYPDRQWLHRRWKEAAPATHALAKRPYSRIPVERDGRRRT